MKENTLTAKEWLEKQPETQYIYEGNLEQIAEYSEQYANYRNKELKDKILEFRENLKNASTIVSVQGEEAEYWLEIYDKHFNIIH